MSSGEAVRQPGRFGGGVRQRFGLYPGVCGATTRRYRGAPRQGRKSPQGDQADIGSGVGGGPQARQHSSSSRRRRGLRPAPRATGRRTCPGPWSPAAAGCAAERTGRGALRRMTPRRRRSASRAATRVCIPPRGRRWGSRPVGPAALGFPPLRAAATVRPAGPAPCAGRRRRRRGNRATDAGPQPGGHHVDVERGGIGRVDAADDRRHEPVQHAPAHPPADQADTLVASPAVPSEAGSTASMEARREPSRPRDRRTSGPMGWPGCRARRSWAVPAGRRAAGPRRRRGSARRSRRQSRVRRRDRLPPRCGWRMTPPRCPGSVRPLHGCPHSRPRRRRPPARWCGRRPGRLPGRQQPGNPAADHDGGAFAPRTSRRPALRPCPLLRRDGVDEFDDASQHSGIRLRGHTVAQVQDVAGRRGACRDHVADVCFQDLHGAERSAGSMLPCSGTVPPRRRLASSSGSR